MATECSWVGHHQAVAHVVDLGAHRALALDARRCGRRAAGRRRGPSRPARSASRAVTRACMIPLVTTPSSTAACDRARLADRVERPHVVLVAVLDAVGRAQVDAEAGAVERRTRCRAWRARCRRRGRRRTRRGSARPAPGPRPVWTTPGPTTHSSRLPSARAWRMPSATWRTSTVCGVRPRARLRGGERARPPRRGSATETRMPEAPTTMLHAGRDVGHRARSAPASRRRRGPSTTRPQSISGFSTSCHAPSRRTRVSRLVVE